MEQNIQKKFNQVQNEVRLAIMDFIINEKRPFNLETDGFGALKNIRLSSEKDSWLWAHGPQLAARISDPEIARLNLLED